MATWLVAGGHDRIEEIAHALDATGADAIALQSVRRHDAEQIAAALGHQLAWALSHHPRSRLIPRSGVGLAMLTSHRITASADGVSNDHPSTWSARRRIWQTVAVERHDHSAYSFGHAVGATERVDASAGPPAVLIVPEQVGVEASHAIRLPDGAALVDHMTTRPLDALAPLLVATFEMAWVRGDFDVA